MASLSSESSTQANNETMAEAQEDRAKAVRAGTERKVVYIGSRKSELAMIQTTHVKRMLERHHGDNYTFIIKTTSTLGDEVLDVPLSVVGSENPGLFTKELEHGLIRGSYDLAVHSLKDMPTTLPATLALSGILKREDPTDCLVLHKDYSPDQFHPEKRQGITYEYEYEFKRIEILQEMPPGSVIGTSSLRRQAIIKKYYPHLVVKSIRGNLNTRLKKLDSSTILSGRNQKIEASQSHDKTSSSKEKVHYDAIVLATSGMLRMGWEKRISQILRPDIFAYGVSQGSLGIESRAGDSFVKGLIAPLTCRESSWRCLAERAFLKAMQGGCQVPLGVHSILTTASGNVKYLCLSGSVYSLDGKTYIYEGMKESIASDEDAISVGAKVAKMVLDQGGAELLKEFAIGEKPRAITYSNAAQ